MSRRSQKGYVLFTVVAMLVVVAVIAFLVSYDSSLKASMPEREAEVSRANYVAEAAMQHALWYTQNNACMGDVTIPTTALGADSYAATVTGAAAGTAYALTADQDAWIRNDDVTRNNGTNATNHVRFEAGNVEQVLTRFDLSSLPADAKINSAVAWFHLKLDKTHPEGPITVHQVMADWAETTVTWDSFGGGYSGASIGMIPAQDTGDVWVAINLTGQVQAWINGQPNYGILFNSTAEGLHTEYTAREDGANPPRLEVVVGSGPASPVTIQATGTLDNGVTRTLSQPIASAYQPPGIVTLQLGTDPGADAMLDSFYPRNYGAQDFVQVNENTGNWIQRPVFKFGLGRIPARAAILSAQLELRLRSITTPGTITVHRVARSWIEGTKYGTGTADGATWATYDGTRNWKTAGGDFNAAAVAETVIAGTDTWVTWEVGPLVQQWLDGEPNNGLLIKSDGILEEAGFYSKEEADASLRPKLTITYACECGNACMATQGAGNVLMVVDSTTSPWGEDIYKRDLLESWGYTVTMLADGHGQSTFDSAIAANDVILVSETIASTDLGTKLGNPAIGIVNTDGWMNDELGFESANSSNWPVGKSINITDTSHYITAPFVAGALDIYDAAMGGLGIDGTAAPDLQLLANWPTGAGLATLDTGALTAGGTTTAGRRVMLPFGRDADIFWPKVNNNGHLILKRSLDWAMGIGKIDAGKLLLVVGDANNPANKDADRRDLFVSWGYAVTLIDDGADQLKFDTEAAANDVIYVTASIGGGTLADKLTGATTAIVSEFGGKLDNFGFSASTTNTFTADTFTSTDAAHYISSPFGGAAVSPVTTFLTMPIPGGSLAPGLQVPASFTGFERGIVALDVGAARWDGGLAPARRVHLPFGPAEVAQLTPDGKTLTKRAIEWATAPPASLGPIAHWKLDETSGATALDSEGGHDGTLQDMDPPGDWVAGQVDGALDFDGFNDYVDLTADAELTDVFDGGATVTAWIYPRSWGESDNGRILDKASEVSGDRDGWMIGLVGTTPALQFAQGFTGVRGYWRSQSGTVSLNEWVHIAVVYDASSVANDARIYLDGIEQSPLVEITPTGTIATDAGISLRMGNYAQDTSRTFDGIIDDVRIYERMLSATEVADQAVPPPTLPIAHWKLDETSGQTAVDSASGHNGTLPNGSDWMPGYLDGGLSLDGSSDHVSVPHDDTLSLSTFSITAWVQASSLSGWQIILSKGSSSGWNYYLGTTGSEISMGFQDGGTWAEFPTSGAALTTGQWYHLAGTFDYSTGGANIYLDGALIHSDTTALRPVANTDALTLGTSPANEYWPGMLDDVRLYDRVLDAAEIADLATNTVALLLVVDNAASLSSKESDTKAQFESWGYIVTAITANSTQAAYDTAVAGVDVAYISATISSADLGAKLKAASIGIVSEDAGTMDDMGLAEPVFVNRSTQLIDISDNTHYVTSGLSLGDLAIVSSSISIWTVNGALASGLQILGETKVGGTGYPPGVAVLDVGATLWGGGSAAGRRVQVPWSQGSSTFDLSMLTSEGLDIMRRALEWAAGSGGGGGGGGGGNDSFRDEFNTASSYSGSDGTLSWATDWLEINESDGANRGDERVLSAVGGIVARVQDNDSSGEGLEREADLSGYTVATLTFNAWRSGLDNTSDYVTIDVSANGGSSWTELDRIEGPGTDADASPLSMNFDISAFIGPNTRIRFLTSSGMGGTDRVYLDNVQIEVE